MPHAELSHRLGDASCGFQTTCQKSSSEWEQAIDISVTAPIVLRLKFGGSKCIIIHTIVCSRIKKSMYFGVFFVET